MQRSEDGCDMRRFRSFYHSTCKTVLILPILRKYYRLGYFRSADLRSHAQVRFDSKRALSLLEIFEYLPSPISYLFNRMTPIFHIGYHAYSKLATNKINKHASRLLAHYGPPSTETPTTETTTVRCHKNSRIYLTSTYW